MTKPQHPPGDPMTLGNMRQLGVQRLVSNCLNPSCPGAVGRAGDNPHEKESPRQ
jgi:hypothetical protein